MIIKDLLKSYYKFLLNPNPIKFVDLGLSVLWADRNIGANSETEYGDYFKWKGIEPVQRNNKDSSAPSLTNDTVNIKLGGFCRMPTKKEIEELIKLPNEWVKNYKNLGLNGRVFTGNGNSIFIPAAGYLDKFDDLGGIGSDCYLWSSSLNSSDPDCAWYLYSRSNYADLYNDSHYYGFSVRGVYPK